MRGGDQSALFGLLPTSPVIPRPLARPKSLTLLTESLQRGERAINTMGVAGADRSVNARRALERGELDIALFKRDASEGGGIAAWPERLQWVASRKRPIDFRRDPLPLVMNEHRVVHGDVDLFEKLA